MKYLTYALALALLTSCSAQGNIKKPDIAINNVRLENITLFQTSAVFDVQIDNENPFPLEISGGVHKVYLNGTYIGKGLDKEGFKVPRLGSTQHSILVRFKNLKLLTDMQNLVEKQELNYRIESELYQEGSWRSISMVNKGSFTQ